MKYSFKTICSIITMCAMVIIVPSCTKEFFLKEGMQHIPGVERTITPSASFPQSADKAHIDGNLNVVWDFGDAININGTDVAINSIRDNGTVGEFYPGTFMANTLNRIDHYWAVYPTTLAGAYSGGVYLPADFSSTTDLTVHLPATQIVDLAVADTMRGLTYMAAHAAVAEGTNEVHFQMRNLGAVVEFDLSSKAGGNVSGRVDSIVFTSANASLSGTFSVNYNSGNPIITPTAGSSKLVVKFRDSGNNYIDISGRKKVRVIFPPLAGKKINMKIFGANDKYEEKYLASATLVRSKYYTSAISDITFNGPKGFSVAADRRVYLAPGNLQWSATGGGSTPTTHVVAGGGTEAGTFRFAPRQWDYLGNTAGNTTAEANRSTQSAWIDLFGWGTSGWNNGNYWYQPYNSSNSQVGRYTGTNGYGYGPTNGRSYEYDLTGTYANADWGVYNAICNLKTNTTDPPGSWRTLTISEWTYLLNTRRTVSGIRYAKAVVNNVKGMILVPDNWDASIYTLNSTNTSGAPFTANNISSNVWTSLFEASGCAFLPTPGFRYGIELHNVGSYGCYWSSTHKSYNGRNAWAYHFHFDKDQILLEGGESALSRAYGYSVRLAQDIE